MKAAVFVRGKNISSPPLSIEEVSRPQMVPGHVLLRVRACGVCRTDLHIVEGDLPLPRDRVIPGHQIVGEVVDGATDTIPLGARVGAPRPPLTIQALRQQAMLKYRVRPILSRPMAHPPQIVPPLLASRG
jgi:threonine dehydrogenase-like Zn-dependent dehydrogenase